ncbi:hypothetical protein A1O3_00523 [Capronia epimyces CBS 606.96]|uniref:Uncharacterized protein n=1 Tax=Capronia epimyces CBS 606.96 TaxID=1182542 RepID=W9YHG1_9EURO|nr:uncharacterized protein A1O3_00523 [Capronia epimyces CBS 606.96]EXJ91973.1 hypothetical protein A1O3_00523 [Capronia epimyces CBS 606.96]
MDSLSDSTTLLFHGLYRVRESLQDLPAAGEIPVIAVRIGILKDDGLESALCKSLAEFCADCTKEDKEELVETVTRATSALNTLRKLSKEAAKKARWSEDARIQFEDNWILWCTRIEKMANMVIMDEEDRVTLLGFQGDRRNHQLIAKLERQDHRWSKDSSTKNSEETAQTLEDLPYDRLREGSWAYERSKPKAVALHPTASSSSSSILLRPFRFIAGRHRDPLQAKDDTEPARLVMPKLTGVTSKPSLETVFTLPSTCDEKTLITARPPPVRIDRITQPKAPHLGPTQVTAVASRLERPSKDSQKHGTLPNMTPTVGLKHVTPASKNSKGTRVQGTKSSTPTLSSKSSAPTAEARPQVEDKVKFSFERRADGKIVIDEEDAVKIQSLLNPEQFSNDYTVYSICRRPPTQRRRFGRERKISTHGQIPKHFVDGLYRQSGRRNSSIQALWPQPRE